MRQRIGLAQALINDPDLVILDEPTSGLDPLGTRWMKDLIVDLRTQGKTVIMCSHRLEDVQDVCDRIAILNEGELQAYGAVKELLAGRQPRRGAGQRLAADRRPASAISKKCCASTAASSTPSAIRRRRWKTTSCASSRRARRIRAAASCRSRNADGGSRSRPAATIRIGGDASTQP